MISGVAQDKIVLRLGTVAPEETPWGEWMKAWRDSVNQQCENRLQLKIFFGGTLGGENTMVRRCQAGMLDLFGGSTAAIAEIVPELNVLELPYLFENSEEADFIIDHYLHLEIEKIFEKNGLKLLLWTENGWRSMATQFGPVQKPEDLAGHKMRSQENWVHLETYKALGASPVPISVPEVLSSLQTGVVDGFDNTPLFSFAASWYQGIQYYSLTEHIYQPAIVMCNLKKFKDLPASLQRPMLQGREQWQKKGRQGVRELTPLLLENFVQAGKKVVALSPAEKKYFSQKSEKVYAQFKASASSEVLALLIRVEEGKKVYRTRRSD